MTTKTGITLQHDGFLDDEPWDFQSTPRDHYPLLLFYHPLNIYRKQVIKQADVMLAMFLQAMRFPQRRSSVTLRSTTP